MCLSQPVHVERPQWACTQPLLSQLSLILRSVAKQTASQVADNKASTQPRRLEWSGRKLLSPALQRRLPILQLVAVTMLLLPSLRSAPLLLLLLLLVSQKMTTMLMIAILETGIESQLYLLLQVLPKSPGS
jgi:hypothetical protein